MRRRSIRETGIRLSLTAVGLVLLQLSNALTLLTALGEILFTYFCRGLCNVREVPMVFCI